MSFKNSSLTPVIANQTSAKSEAWSTITGLLSGKTSGIPVELLADHLEGVTVGMDWPVLRAATEEILRRISFIKRDELTVVRRPKGKGLVLGTYIIGGKEGKKRPYRTNLLSVKPIRASCDCPDFIKNSLGLCKHVLTALSDIDPSRFSSAGDGLCPAIVWNSIKPALGVGDPLERITIFLDQAEQSHANWNLRKFLKRISKQHWKVKVEILLNPKKRLELVDNLLAQSKLAQGDPALSALLAAEKCRLEKRCDNAEALVDKHITTLKKKLFPYQEESILKFIERGSFLIGDDMGLGKTAQAIGACHIAYKSKRVQKGLLIVPASLKTQWEREWSLFTDVPLILVDGNSEDRRKILRNFKTGFAVANYEQVVRDLDLFRTWEPQIIVLDEAQRIKNWETKTAAYIKALNPDYRLVLTGTPLENRLRELASIMDWVDPHALEPKWRLDPWHSEFADGMNSIIGARNLDVLRGRLAPSFIRRTRKEVITQLPKRTDVRVPVRMTEVQTREHGSFDPDIVKLMALARKRPLRPKEFLRLMTLLMMQRLIANGMALYRFEDNWPEIKGVSAPSDDFLESLSSPKLTEFREIIRQVVLEQGRKVVVFSQWRRMLALANWTISSLFREGGYRTLFFTGQESQKRRTQNVVEFHDEPDARVLLLTDAGGVGLNLQRASDCCVNLDLPWNPAVLEQRIGRIYRLGQKNPIDTYALVSELSIEDRISRLLGSKQALFSGLFEGSSDTILFNESGGGFLSFLQKVVEPVIVPVQHGATLEEELTEDEELAPTVQPEDSLPLDVVAGQSHPDAPSFGNSLENSSGLQVTRLADGRMQFTATPEASKALALLFESMAGSIRGSLEQL